MSGTHEKADERNVTEVRVHGVSGTPPGAILRTDPRLIAARPVPAGAEGAEQAETLEPGARRRRPVDVWIHPVTDVERRAALDAERDDQGEALAHPDGSRPTTGRS